MVLFIEKFIIRFPPKVEYSLTELGETLKPIIMMMRKWGEDYEKVPHDVNNMNK
jgi:DNA-binding HxlR family transcriptional regulator